MGYEYLPSQYETKLSAYKYSGIDHSVLYKYVMSPIANFCLNYVPETLAPNMITLIGTLFVIVPHFILWWVYPVWELDADVSPAMLIFLGVTHLLYMNFDNIDGKQARKTGNSSPLGLLFDHGCDSLVVFMQGISLAMCLRFGESYGTFLVIYIGAFTFFTTTIEEYFTHIMYLPFINGAAEGCFGISVIYFFTALVGGDFWSEVSFGITNRYILLGGFIIAGAANLVGIISRINTEKPEKLGEACYNMLFFLFITLVCSYVIIISPTGLHLMRLVIYIFGLNFAKLVICHVSDAPFVQFRRSNFIIIFILFINTMSGQVMGSEAIVSEETVIWLVLALSLGSYFHLVVSAINQFCRVLHIRAFKVKDFTCKHRLFKILLLIYLIFDV